MTTQRFPARREDGSAEVAAVFHVSLDASRVAVERALQEWKEMLKGIDIFADLANEPQVAQSEEGFRVVFKIQPSSRLWRDWAVALVSSLSRQLGTDAFVGFFDAVTGQMHAASGRDLLGDGGLE